MPFILALALLLLIACQADLSITPTFPVASKERLSLPRMSALTSPMAPGDCTYSVGASGNGLQNPVYTGCDLVDSALYTFVISGHVTATPSPGVTCCAPSSYAFPRVGTYGPMGGSATQAWHQLLTKLQFRYFNDGGYRPFPDGTPMHLAILRPRSLLKISFLLESPWVQRSFSNEQPWRGAGAAMERRHRKRGYVHILAMLPTRTL